MYLTTTTSTEAIEFEGRVWHNTAMVATMQEMERQVLGTNAPPADDPTTERQMTDAQQTLAKKPKFYVFKRACRLLTR